MHFMISLRRLEDCQLVESTTPRLLFSLSRMHVIRSEDSIPKGIRIVSAAMLFSNHDSLKNDNSSLFHTLRGEMWRKKGRVTF